MGILSFIIRNILRVLATIIMFLGAVAFAFFIAIIIAPDGRGTKLLGQVWYDNDPFSQFLDTASLPLFGAIIERKIHPLLWDPVFLWFLGLQARISLIIMALGLAFIGWLIFRLAASLKFGTTNETF